MYLKKGARSEGRDGGSASRTNLEEDNIRKEELVKLPIKARSHKRKLKTGTYIFLPHDAVSDPGGMLSGILAL